MLALGYEGGQPSSALAEFAVRWSASLPVMTDPSATTPWVVAELREADWPVWQQLYRGYGDFYEVAMPVTKLESSDARKSATLAISSGSAMRPLGRWIQYARWPQAAAALRRSAGFRFPMTAWCNARSCSRIKRCWSCLPITDCATET